MNAKGTLRRTLRMGCLLSGIVASAGATGCSTSTRVAPISPAVAFSAPRSDVEQGCSLEGMPRVIATHVVPRAGVSASVSGGRVWLRFETTHDPRVLVAVDTESLETVDDATPPVESAPGTTRGPVEVEVQDHRRLIAWTEGSVNDGLHVRAVTVRDDGSALGAPIDLGFQGSAIGRPAVAFDGDGRGVLAFVESNDIGFQLVVTRAACAAQ
jgi:hypothetical protein